MVPVPRWGTRFEIRRKPLLVHQGGEPEATTERAIRATEHHLFAVVALEFPGALDRQNVVGDRDLEIVVLEAGHVADEEQLVVVGSDVDGRFERPRAGRGTERRSHDVIEDSFERCRILGCSHEQDLLR